MTPRDKAFALDRIETITDAMLRPEDRVPVAIESIPGVRKYSDVPVSTRLACLSAVDNDLFYLLHREDWTKHHVPTDLLPGYPGGLALSVYHEMPARQQAPIHANTHSACEGEFNYILDRILPALDGRTLGAHMPAKGGGRGVIPKGWGPGWVENISDLDLLATISVDRFFIWCMRHAFNTVTKEKRTYVAAGYVIIPDPVAVGAIPLPAWGERSDMEALVVMWRFFKRLRHATVNVDGSFRRALPLDCGGFFK